MGECRSRRMAPEARQTLQNRFLPPYRDPGREAGEERPAALFTGGRMKKRPSKYLKRKQRRLPDALVCPPVKILGKHYQPTPSDALPWEDEKVDELLELGGQA